MSTTAIRPYTDAIAELPPEAFLGSVLFFTISEADVNLEKAREQIVALGLSLDGLRKQLRPIDAFAKAARECAHKFATDGDVRSEVLVRPYGSDTDTVRRLLTLERFEYNQAGKKRRISYDKLAELILDRGERENGEYINHGVEAIAFADVALSSDEAAWLSETLEGFARRYYHHLTHLDSHAVRSFVRAYIDRLDGICLKESGGVYFVMQKRAEEVERLAAWVKEIGSQFHTFPLLNLAEKRAQILEAFEDEAVQEVDRLMVEIAEILKNRARVIEGKTFDDYGRKAAELKRRLAEYTSTLGARADRAEVKIDIFARQVMELLGRVAA